MYCKFKEGDLVMVKRDTKSYYGSIVRKWVCGTVMARFAADSRYDGYVRILLGKNNFTLIPIKDLKKISDKKIPKGSYSAPQFNNGDHVLYKGEPGLLAIEGWVVDNKPYYNECRIVIRTASGKYIFVNECDAQKLKEVSNMLDNGRIIQYKREGDTVTATLYDIKEISDGCKTSKEIISASAKCHPDDRFDLDLGIHIAFTRLMGKWKLINNANGWSNFDKGAFHVRVNKNDVKRFLKMLDEAGYIWMSGQKIFDFVEFFGLTYESDDVFFTAYHNHRVAWSDTLLNVSKCISFDEFCKLV